MEKVSLFYFQRCCTQWLLLLNDSRSHVVREVPLSGNILDKVLLLVIQIYLLFLVNSVSLFLGSLHS